MAKRDINLFKAAGGERAKTSKASPMSIMAVVTVIVISAAVAVGVYYNMKANSAVSAYEKKQDLKNSYAVTKGYVTEKANNLSVILSDIRSAQAINEYIETASHLFPNATDSEVAAVKDTILNNTTGNSYSLNDPVEGERYTPWDYASIADEFYNDEEHRSSENAQLFYYAIKALESAQKAAPKDNVWYTYYRGYMIMMFTGGISGVGIEDLAASFNANTESMNGLAPFSEFDLDNETYSPAKFTYVLYNDNTYNLLMCPMKSVIERALDILEAHSEALVEQEGYSLDQEEFAKYTLKDISYTKTMLSFTLLLPLEAKFPDYCRDFSTSLFFDVDNDVTESGEQEGSFVAYKVMLRYKGVDPEGGNE